MFGTILVVVLFLLAIGFIVLIIFLMKGAKNPPRVLRLVYLYLLSFVGIVITVVSSIGMIDLVLKNYVFQVNNYGYYSSPEFCASSKGPDNVNPATPAEIEKCKNEQLELAKSENQNQIKRDLSSQIAGLLIGLPLWLYHWSVIRKQKEEEEV